MATLSRYESTVLLALQLKKTERSVTIKLVRLSAALCLIIRDSLETSRRPAARYIPSKRIEKESIARTLGNLLLTANTTLLDIQSTASRRAHKSSYILSIQFSL